MIWPAVIILGGLGAIARTLVDRAVTRLHRGVMPLGIFVVNMTGAFALGVMTGGATGHDLRLALGTGFLGGFTTFSTWVADSRRLVDARLRREAVFNIIGALACGLIAVVAGWALGAWLDGSTRF